MKKTWSILLTLVLSVGLLAGCGNDDKSTDSGAANGGSEGSQDKKRIALVLPEKIGVNPFFALMDEGLQRLLPISTLKSKRLNRQTLLRSSRTSARRLPKYDLIITSTFQMEDALKKVAPENPDVPFAIIDTVVDLPNVRSVGFREHEAAYLLGAAAGLATKRTRSATLWPTTFRLCINI